jgi:hypothetical protein
MVRVMGNSAERVRIKDLGDVIYYRQTKDYTDDEFESSRDLKRALQKGMLVKVDSQEPPRPSVGVYTQPTTSMEGEIKRIIREAKDDGQAQAVKDAVREALPLLAQVVREEIAHIQIALPQKTEKTEDATPDPDYIDPSYIPDVSTKGLNSNVTADTREVSGNDVDSSLDALRKFQNRDPK